MKQWAKPNAPASRAPKAPCVSLTCRYSRVGFWRALFNIGVTFIVHRHALVDFVEMYAQADEGESEITQASPSTGHKLPGPLPAGEIADGVGGGRTLDRMWKIR